jgi:putative FmdB family regulatory protein
MPTYEYACGNCGHTMEALQSIKSRPLRKCPSCRRLTLKRLIGTGAGIIFKGSGFYQTDYRSDSYNKSAKSDTPVKAETPAKTANPVEPAKKKDTGKKET